MEFKSNVCVCLCVCVCVCVCVSICVRANLFSYWQTCKWFYSNIAFKIIKKLKTTIIKFLFHMVS